MPIQPGEFWVADIPFTDGTASKRRPVLVLWLDGADLVAAAVTSAAPRSETDVALADLISRIGMISSRDAQFIRQVWASQIRPQF